MNLAVEPDPVRGLHFVEPLAVEAGLGLGLGKNLEHLRHVGLGVAHDFFRAQRRAGGGASGGVANHAGKIADQKDDRVAEVLKMLELAQEHGVAEMEIGRGRIESGFYAQRLAGSKRLLQLGTKLGLLHNFGRALLDVGELFVNRREGGHLRDYTEGCTQIDELPNFRIVELKFKPLAVNCELTKIAHSSLASRCRLSSRTGVMIPDSTRSSSQKTVSSISSTTTPESCHKLRLGPGTTDGAIVRRDRSPRAKQLLSERASVDGTR